MLQGSIVSFWVFIIQPNNSKILSTEFNIWIHPFSCISALNYKIQSLDWVDKGTILISLFGVYWFVSFGIYCNLRDFSIENMTQNSEYR